MDNPPPNTHIHRYNISNDRHDIHVEDEEVESHGEADGAIIHFTSYSSSHPPPPPPPLPPLNTQTQTQDEHWPTWHPRRGWGSGEPWRGRWRPSATCCSREAWQSATGSHSSWKTSHSPSTHCTSQRPPPLLANLTVTHTEIPAGASVLPFSFFYIYIFKNNILALPQHVK